MGAPMSEHGSIPGSPPAAGSQGTPGTPYEIGMPYVASMPSMPTGALGSMYGITNMGGIRPAAAAACSSAWLGLGSGQG